MAEKFTIDRKLFDTFSPARQKEILSTMTTEEAIDLGFVDDPFPVSAVAVPDEEPVKVRVERVKPAPPSSHWFEDMLEEMWWGVVRLAAVACIGLAWCSRRAARGMNRAGRHLQTLARERG